MTDRLRRKFEALMVATGYHTLPEAEQRRLFRLFCAGVLVTIEADRGPDLGEWMHDVTNEIDRTFTDVSRN